MSGKFSPLPIPTADSFSLLDHCPHFSCPLPPSKLYRCPHSCQKRQTLSHWSSEPSCWKPGFINLFPPNDPGFPAISDSSQKECSRLAQALLPVYACLHHTCPEFAPLCSAFSPFLAWTLSSTLQQFPPRLCVTFFPSSVPSTSSAPSSSS